MRNCIRALIRMSCRLLRINDLTRNCIYAHGAFILKGSAAVGSFFAICIDIICLMCHNCIYKSVFDGTTSVENMKG